MRTHPGPSGLLPWEAEPAATAAHNGWMYRNVMLLSKAVHALLQAAPGATGAGLLPAAVAQRRSRMSGANSTKGRMLSQGHRPCKDSACGLKELNGPSGVALLPSRRVAARQQGGSGNSDSSATQERRVAGGVACAPQTSCHTAERLCKIPSHCLRLCTQTAATREENRRNHNLHKQATSKHSAKRAWRPQRVQQVGSMSRKSDTDRTEAHRLHVLHTGSTQLLPNSCH